MAGISGGGWVCLGAANILSKQGNGYKVKAQFLQTPMISDEVGMLKDEDREDFERPLHAFNTSLFKMLATDYDK